MEQRLNILLVTNEDAVANMISSTLNSSQHMALAGICHEVSQLRTFLEHTVVAAVIVDIDPNPSQVLNDLDVIISMHPEMRFVVLSSKFNNKLVLAAMQAGARHFLLKSSISSEFVKVLQRLVSDSVKKESILGSVISVFSSGGGCGATTVTLNLANELRLTSSEPVLVIDLDRHYGALSSYLGISGQYGIADVLEHKGPIDKHLVRTSACSYMEDFHVLMSPASIEYDKPKPIKYQNLVGALDVCRQAYKYTVVDAPRLSKEVTRDLAGISEAILVVFQLTVKDVRFAGSVVSSLTKSGVAPARIIPLANQFKRRSSFVRLEDSKKTLGLDLLYRVRSDWRNAINCVNRGQLLAEVAPRSGLRRDFRKLAAQIDMRGTNGDGRIRG